MSTNFHVGDFGKLGCLAMGDENKDASEFRATKQGLQILSISEKTRLLRREEEYHFATWKHSKLQLLVEWQFINLFQLKQVAGTWENRWVSAGQLAERPWTDYD